jgi:L-lactate dehydrogenase complex protein LldE
MLTPEALPIEEVDFFVPCFVDQFYPDAAMAAVEVLEALGCRVRVPEGATCCGQPAYNAGYWEEAKPVAAKWLRDFGPNKELERTVVVLSSSCTGMLRNGYRELLPASGPEFKAWEQARPRILEFVEFVHAHPHRNRLNSVFQHKISYHDACSALRECGIRDQVRDLLSGVRGLELVELPETKLAAVLGAPSRSSTKGFRPPWRTKKSSIIAKPAPNTWSVPTCLASCTSRPTATVRVLGSKPCTWPRFWPPVFKNRRQVYESRNPRVLVGIGPGRMDAQGL